MDNRKRRKMTLQPYQNNIVEKRFLGGLLSKTKEAFKGASDFVGRGIERIKKATESLFSNNLPKSFRDTLERNKDKKIVNIEVCREPVSSAVKAFANLITLGTYNEESRKRGEAGFFHLYSILTLEDGTRLIYEKNERPVLQVSNKQVGPDGKCVSINANVSLGEFMEKSIKRMGEDLFITYDPLRNNCQDQLLNSLQANGLLNQELRQFIKQDTEDLIENTPAFSKILAKNITGLGGTLRQAWEELIMKSGGRIKRLSRN